MRFLKSRGGAAAVTALVILFSAVFGMGRSLNAVRSDIWMVWDQGANGDGHSLREDLGVRYATCANLYTVAAKYLPQEELAALRAVLDQVESGSMEYYDELDPAARTVIQRLDGFSLSDQDAKYVSGFLAELDSRTLTIAKDPYTQDAIRFNTETLAAFPASLARALNLVDALPVYH